MAAEVMANPGQPLADLDGQPNRAKYKRLANLANLSL
jgi:hypothetical protein